MNSSVKNERANRRSKLTLTVLFGVLFLLIALACIISYQSGAVLPDYTKSPIEKIGNSLYESGMGHVYRLKSDTFSLEVLYALEKEDADSYNQLANGFMKQILALKNDTLSDDEILFVEAVYFVCKAEYTARQSEYLAGLPLTGFLYAADAKTDRAGSDEMYAMITGAKTMTDIRRVHDFGREFLKMTDVQ